MSTTPPEKPSFAPGMSMPVVAGEEYTLKDMNGDSLVIEGRDDPLTIGFIEAFNTYIVMRALYDAEHEQSKKAWQGCLDAFEALPNRIKTGLNGSTLGITLPTRPL